MNLVVPEKEKAEEDERRGNHLLARRGAKDGTLRNESDWVTNALAR